MRVAFRKMGGAGDGKVDLYEFMTCLRNLGVGAGQPALIKKLFHEIDDDHSGHLTFAEFTGKQKIIFLFFEFKYLTVLNCTNIFHFFLLKFYSRDRTSS